MKSFISLLLIAVITGCGTGSANDELKTFIPGTYVRAVEHEFGAEHDTIVIVSQNTTANEYKLTRRWKYERVLDGKPIEPEYKNTNTSGIYNPETKMLQESETGETYSFDINQKAMFAGSTKYSKLK